MCLIQAMYLFPPAQSNLVSLSLPLSPFLLSLFPPSFLPLFPIRPEGSQRISDSEISDYDCEEGVGVITGTALSLFTHWEPVKPGHGFTHWEPVTLEPRFTGTQSNQGLASSYVLLSSYVLCQHKPASEFCLC